MNIQLAILHGTNILTDKRINTAKLDAEILMAKTLKKDRKFIILNNNKDLEAVSYTHLRAHETS